MSRVLFCGDLAATGFGTVTMDLGRAMLDGGDDLRFVSLNEVPDLPEPFASRTMRLGSGWLTTPTNAEEAAVYLEREARLFGAWEDGWVPEAVILLSDFEGMRQLIERVPLPPDLPVFHYCPIEGDGLPPRWAQAWAGMTPVAMSEFGADQIATVTGTRPPVVYHGVNTADFYPASAEWPIYLEMPAGTKKLRSKADCRRFLDIAPDRIVLYRADRLMPRKMYPSLLRSLAPVLARHPEAAFLYHCSSRDEGLASMEDEKSKYGALAARMVSTGIHDRGQYAPRELLNVFYNAADVYVSNSSEGFGLTIAESLAAGTPAIGIDYSAVPEVIGPAGITVPIGTRIDNVYSHFWGWADERKFTAAVEELVTDATRRQTLGRLGPAHVRATFTWPAAARQFSALVAGAVRSEVAA